MLPDGSFTISTPSGKDYNYKLLPTLTWECYCFCKDTLVKKLINPDASTEFFNQDDWKKIILLQSTIDEPNYRYLTVKTGLEIKKKLSEIIKPAAMLKELIEEFKKSSEELKETGVEKSN